MTIQLISGIGAVVEVCIIVRAMSADTLVLAMT